MTRCIALGTLILGCLGCSDSAPPPLKPGPVSGTLTIDGKAPARANIRFISLEASAVNALAQVKDGTFAIPVEQGLVKGKYRIEFSVPSANTRKMRNPDNPLEWMVEAQETLPARFHRESEYTIDYDPEGTTTYKWELNTRQPAGNQ
jgi:hypothetical protein